MQKRPGVPWSVKGIDDDARKSAKLAARQAGMTLGEWLTNMIKENASEDSPSVEQTRGAPARFEQSAATPSRSRSSRDDDISRRLDSLAGQLSMLSQPRSSASVSRAPVARHISSSVLPTAQDTVAIQSLIDRIEASERASAEVMGQLNARLDNVADRLGQSSGQVAMPHKPEDVPGFNALETAMRNIVDHIEASELSTRETLKSIQQRMGEMATRAAQAASDQINRNAPALSSLEQRISELNARLERSRAESSQEMQAYVEGHINQLSERIDAVRHSADALVGQAQAAAMSAARQENQHLEQRLGALIQDLQSRQGVDPDVKRIYAEVESLNRRLDEVASQAASDHELQSIRSTIEGLSGNLSRAEDTQQQIAELSQRIEGLGSVDLTPQLSELEKRVRAMDEQLHQAANNPSDPASAARFSDQLNSVADRLSATETKLNHLATIEQAIEQLYRSAEETRNWAGEAAEEAAQRAVKAFSGADAGSVGSGSAPSVELQALESGLNAVRASAEQADQRTQETLEAVHDTLEQIIEKLAQLESRPGQSRYDTAGEPDSAGPYPQARDDADGQPMTAFDVEDAFAPIHRPVATPQTQSNEDFFAGQASFDPRPEQPSYSAEAESVTTCAPAENPSTAHADMGVPDPAAVEQARHETHAATPDPQAADPAPATSSGVQEDFIAAARRAAQNASSQRNSILGGITALSSRPAAVHIAADEDKKPKSRFSLPFRRKSVLADPDDAGQPSPDGDEDHGDVSASRRKYLIIAGIALLAAVAAFALGGGKTMFSSSAVSPNPVIVGSKTSNLSAQAAVTTGSQPAVDVASALDRLDRQTGAPTLAASPAQVSATAEPVEPLPAPEVVTASLPVAAGALGDTPDTDASPAGQAQPDLLSDAPSQAESAADELPAELGPVALRSAALAGDANAQFIIASRYLDGKSVDQDFGQAAEWYRKAAAQGSAPAQYRLGTLYERGHGVAKNIATARQWYESAASNDNVKAMHNLAVIYANSDNGEAQFDKAAKWFRAAAEHGLKDSLYNLAVLYERGLGVEQDTKTAYYWFGIAARHGDAGAQAKVESLKSFLTSEQRNDMDERIAQWQPRQPERAGNFVAINDPSWQVSVTAPAAPDSPVNQFDGLSEKELVLKAQQMLSAMGYDVGPMDGVMGSRTANAVRLFQLQTGMTVNGNVSPELVSRLSSRAS